MQQENEMLSGKTAVVTGASRGIGRAIAEKLAAEGAFVVINYNGSKEAAETVLAGIRAAGGDGCVMQCNVSDFAACEAWMKEILALYGKIDILVNNAGISFVGLLQDMSDAQWSEILNTNLSSVFYCCRQAIPPMVSKRSGKIINISSMWGLSGASCEVAYSASKSGINGFTKALAKELAPSNVQVNAIACGVIDTSMNDQLTPEERKALEDEIPAGRYGTPKEIAQMVWNIVHAPEYMTGQIIGVDGGFL